MAYLVDNKPLNDVLREIVQCPEWRGVRPDLKNRDFVRDNKNQLARSIIFKWFTSHFIDTLSDADVRDAVRDGWLVESDYADDWMRQARANGKTLYVFHGDKFSDKQTKQINLIVKYFEGVCGDYLDSELAKENPNVSLGYLGTEYSGMENVLGNIKSSGFNAANKKLKQSQTQLTPMPRGRGITD